MYNVVLQGIKRRVEVMKTTKTLKYLEEKTGIKWHYNYDTSKLYNSLEHYRNNLVYDIKTGKTYANVHNEIIINFPHYYRTTKLSPREFIEKIEKGEWI